MDNIPRQEQPFILPGEPVVPEEKRRSSYWKWLLIAGFLVGLGLMALSLSAKYLIREVVQEIDIEKAAGIDRAEINKPLPFFELKDLEGNLNRSSDLIGTPAVVIFWTTWNQTSADQIKILDDYKGHPCNKDDPCMDDDLFQIVAVNSQEDKSVVVNFMRRGGYQVTALLDDSGAVGELYGARNLPATYFIDKDGMIRDVYIGILSEKALLEKAEAILR